MPKKSRTPLAPLDEIQRKLLCCLGESHEPLSAKNLVRRLPAEYRAAIEVLGQILDEATVGGRLIRLESARGETRYWDRSTAATARQELVDSLGRLQAPCTLKEWAAGARLGFRATEPDLAPLVAELLDSQSVFEIPPKTAKGKPRYWRDNRIEFAQSEIISGLRAKGPQPPAALKRLVKWLSDDEIAHVVQTGMAQKRLWRHPSVKKGKAELIAAHPPSPTAYLAPAAALLRQFVEEMRAVGVAADAIRRSIIEMLGEMGIDAVGAIVASDRSAASAQEIDLFALMRRIQPGADRGALVMVRELRLVADLPKSVFDGRVLELARQGKLSLHRHDFAANLSNSERDELVSDGEGGYYVGVALRVGGAPSEK